MDSGLIELYVVLQNLDRFFQLRVIQWHMQILRYVGGMCQIAF